MSNNKTVTVTKEFIINAIKQAKRRKLLFPGSWLAWDNSESQQKPGKVCTRKIKECSVCAVGAIFRSALAPKDNGYAVGSFITDSLGGYDWHTPLFLYDIPDSSCTSTKVWLSALSRVFESSNGDSRKTLAFVREHFPPTLDIDINGFDLDPRLKNKLLVKEPEAQLEE